MCRNSIIGCDCNGETAVTITAPVRVAPGQNSAVISGFDTPTPIGKGK